jgi:hypothetical protein
MVNIDHRVLAECIRTCLIIEKNLYSLDEFIFSSQVLPTELIRTLERSDFFSLFKIDNDYFVCTDFKIKACARYNSSHTYCNQSLCTELHTCVQKFQENGCPNRSCGLCHFLNTAHNRRVFNLYGIKLNRIDNSLLMSFYQVRRFDQFLIYLDKT